MKNTALLTAPISTLSLRQDTIQLAQAMGYQTLQDLFDVDSKILFEKKEFTYRWFFEVCDFMERNDLLTAFDKIS